MANRVPFGAFLHLQKQNTYFGEFVVVVCQLESGLRKGMCRAQENVHYVYIVKKMIGMSYLVVVRAVKCGSTPE
jgi:hypothetical protein